MTCNTCGPMGKPERLNSSTVYLGYSGHVCNGLFDLMAMFIVAMFIVAMFIVVIDNYWSCYSGH